LRELHDLSNSFEYHYSKELSNSRGYFWI
jgi:hypothetical protein